MIGSGSMDDTIEIAGRSPVRLERVPLETFGPVREELCNQSRDGNGLVGMSRFGNYTEGV